MHPVSPTGLYWSTRGDVACDEHAPDVCDPRWNAETWKPLIPVHPTKRPMYCCQDCNGGPLVHRRRGAYGTATLYASVDKGNRAQPSPEDPDKHPVGSPSRHLLRDSVQWRDNEPQSSVARRTR